MNIDSFKLMLKCPDSQALIFAQEDFALRWHQKLALRGHLMICKMCARTEHNVATLRGSLGRWRAYGSES
jgi:hypothetical protein